MIDEKTIAESYLPINMPVKDAVHLDVPYIDGVIDGQGMVFEHWRAMPCPIGKNDPLDVRQVHEDHSGCSNGHIYTFAGTMTCIFSGASKQLQMLDMGLVTGSTVNLTFPLYYSDNPQKEVFVAYFDRLYLKATVAPVIATQLFEHNIGGMDRVKYPIVSVEHLMDSNGLIYHESQDFVLERGQIKWIGPKQPGMDPATSKGEVCSIRYRYYPYWYVSHILHESRVVRNGPSAIRAPMAALIQREYVFENERNDALAKSSQRQVVAPREGSFGPR